MAADGDFSAQLLHQRSDDPHPEAATGLEREILRQPGAAITLSASASDAEEGDLSASILWTSDIDGFLGQGTSVVASGLRAGFHTITAAVEDATGLRASEVVHVLVDTLPTISIVAPADGAFLDPGQPVVFEAQAADAEDGDLGS